MKSNNVQTTCKINFYFRLQQNVNSSVVSKNKPNRLSKLTEFKNYTMHIAPSVVQQRHNNWDDDNKKYVTLFDP